MTRGIRNRSEGRGAAPPPWLLGALATIVLGTLGVGQTGSAAAAKRAPDLKASVKSAPERSHWAGTIEPTAIVRNVGKKPAKPSVVRAYLSPTRTRAKSSVRLVGKSSVGRLRPGKHRRVQLHLMTPVGISGPRYLVICADDARRVAERRERNNCGASEGTVTVTQEPVTTADLVDRDVAKGRITSGQAVLYKVYGAFGDPRLPSRYAGGDDPFDAGTAATEDAAAAWGSLSPSTRERLVPFFQPPIYRSSWYAQRAASAKRSALKRADDGQELDCAGEPVADDGTPPGPSPPIPAKGWRTRSAVGGKVKIWWCRDDSRGPEIAERWASALGSPSVWDKFTKLMGRAPLSDAGTHPTDNGGAWGDGGDGALDVYIGVPMLTTKRAMTMNYPPGCSHRPAFILDLSNDVWLTRSEMAHEFFHAIQFAFKRRDCDSLDANHIDEATAQWSMNYAFPNDDEEHSSNPQYEPMISSPDSEFSALARDDYDQWVFWLFVEKKLGAARVAALYNALSTKDVVQAINAALPGGIDRQWPRFSRYAWNQPPVAAGDTPRNWDHVFAVPQGGNDAPVQDVPITLEGKDEATYPFKVDLDARTRAYASYEVADKNAREIKVENPLAGRSNAHLDALLQLENGQARVEDLSDRSELTLCRKNASENVESIVLVPSNTSLRRAKASGTVKVKARSQCHDFPKRWTGTASGTATEPGKWTETFKASGVTLTRYAQGNGGANYELTAAHVDWSYSDGDCSVSESYDVDSIPIGMLIFEYDDPEVPDEYDIDLRLAGGDFNPGCGVTAPLNGTGAGDLSAQRQWTPGATHLSGTESHPSGWNPDIQVNWQWNLNAG